MLERIKILFFGSDWDVIEHYVISDGEVKKNIIHSPKSKTAGPTPREKNKIAVVQIEGPEADHGRIKCLTKLLFQDNLICCYFVLKSANIVSLIKAEAVRLNLNEVEVYGVDPDYFYSLAPLNGDHHKIAERYVQGLKGDLSIKGKIKKSMKNILININLSGVIYEGFVVSVKGMSPADK